MQVAISLGNADVAQVPGVTNADVERIHHDLVKRLIQRGHVAVYGGDLKPTGLSETLIDLATQVVSDPDAVRANPETCLRNAVAWPIYHNYSDEDLATHNLGAVFENFPPPASMGLSDADLGAFVPPDTPERRVLWSKSFSHMREELDKSLDARLVVVGRGIGSSGAVPGIFEETVVAVRGRTPLFLVGGFGGVAVSLIEAFTKGTTAVFTREAQLSHPPLAGFYDYLDAQGMSELADFEGMVKELHDAGVAGLNNGLTAEENEFLFTSNDWNAVAELMLDGLDRLKS